MKGTKSTAMAILAIALAFTQGFAQQKGSFTDPRDKKKYATVKIGEQTWMSENLNYADKSSKCYGNNAVNCTKYGRLYDWETAMKACPKGWHLPKSYDWYTLSNAIGGVEAAGKLLKSKSGWNKNEEGNEDSDGNGKDEFGFAALPGGESRAGKFESVGDYGYWWTSTPDQGRAGDPIWIFYRADFNSDYINSAGNSTTKDLFSVRCIEDDSAYIAAVKAEAEAAAKDKAIADSIAKAEAAIAKAKADSIAAVAKAEKERETRIKANSGAFTDSRDKKAYKTIKIGAQTWMSENLNYDAKGSHCYGSKLEYCIKYGKLYDWKNAMRACPAGWHLPTKDEWETLNKTAGGDNVAGAALKARDGWKYYSQVKGGDDKFGFAALPGGGAISGYFKNAVEHGNWWSATENSAKAGNAHFARLLYSGPNLGRIDDPKTNLFSVRCVKGEAGKEAKAAIAKIEADEKAAAKPAAQPAQQQKPAQSGGQEFCSIAMMKACVAVPKGTCAMTGGKVVSKCP